MNKAFIEALDHYYKLKTTYEEAKNRQINKIKANENLSQSKKIAAIKNINVGCVNCGHKDGTIFEYKDRVLIAKCNNSSEPCKLDIRLFKGAYITQETSTEYWRKEMDNDKLNIIILKLNLLFGYLTDSEALEKFTEQKESFKEASETYEDHLLDLIKNTDNKEKNITVKELTSKLEFEILSMKQLLVQYNRTNNPAFINECVEKYKETVMPLLKNIRDTKYEYMSVEYNKDTDTHRLVQKPFTIETLEIALEPAQIISNIYGK